jgi:hypothetical protein
MQLLLGEMAYLGSGEWFATSAMKAEPLAPPEP